MEKLIMEYNYKSLFGGFLIFIIKIIAFKFDLLYLFAALLDLFLQDFYLFVLLFVSVHNLLLVLLIDFILLLK